MSELSERLTTPAATITEAIEGKPRDTAWIQTYSGRQFWLLDPKPQDVDINDIAHALAMKCRYTGHCRKFYSVAQHSVLMARHLWRTATRTEALWALMHDATEAYMPDVARPIKQWLPELKAMEAGIEAAIVKRFGLPLPMPESIKRMDLVMLATERRDLMAEPPVPWISTRGVDPLAETIVSWVPETAERVFLTWWRGIQLSVGLKAFHRGMPLEPIPARSVRDDWL